MKKILLGLILSGICVSTNATEYRIIESSITVYTVDVSSFVVSTNTATVILTSAQTMKNAEHFLLQNLDTGSDIFCGYQILESTTSVNVFKVPKSGDIVKLDMRPFVPYCLTEYDGTSRLTVIQGY